MQNLRNKLIAAGTVVIMAAIGTVMNREAAQAQGSVVTIGAPIPLPVEARQVGTWNVGLTGTPNVNVTAPPIVPFLTRLCNTTGSFYSCGGLPSAFTVPQTTPSGAPVSRLVIEYVSGSCNTLGAGSQISFVALTTPGPGGFSTIYNFVPGLVIPASSSATTSSFAQLTRIYGMPGTLFFLEQLPVLGVVASECSAAISGQLLTQ
jgi:hypothetical protein